MSDQHNFVLLPVDPISTADPLSETLARELKVSLGGGPCTRELFADSLGPLQHFYGLIATGGDSIWLNGTQGDGNPVMFVEEGDTFFTVGAVFDDLETLEQGTDGPTDLKSVGTGYVTLTTPGGSSQQIVRGLEYGGAGIAGVSDGSMNAQLLQPIVQSLVNYVVELAKKVLQTAGSLIDPEQAMITLRRDSDAAAVAARTSVKVGDMVVDVVQKVGEGDVIKAIGSLAQIFVVALLQKPMYDYVRIYNATGLDLDLGLCWVATTTAAEMAPAPVGETASLPAVGPTATSTGVGASATAVYYSDLLMINSELKESIGFVLQATPNGDFPGLRAMVDIPSHGDNSLYVSFGTDDCETVWNDQKGLDTGLVASATSQGGRFRLQIATNQVSGKSPSPVSAVEGYNYCHLLVLSDDTVDLPVT